MSQTGSILWRWQHAVFLKILPMENALESSLHSRKWNSFISEGHQGHIFTCFCQCSRMRWNNFGYWNKRRLELLMAYWSACGPHQLLQRRKSSLSGVASRAVFVDLRPDVYIAVWHLPSRLAVHRKSPQVCVLSHLLRIVWSLLPLRSRG